MIARLFSVIFTLILMAMSLVPQSFAADEGALDIAHEALLSNDSYDLDYASPSDLDEQKNRLKPTSNFIELIMGLLGYLFYAICALVIGLIAYFLLRNALNFRRPKRAEKITAAPEPSYVPDKQTARILLKDAAKLAEDGKFDDAVHLILLRTIQDIKDKRPRAVPDALTSREISKLEILSSSARDGFAEIGHRVERSLFGGRALGLDDYEASRKAYENFAFGPLFGAG